MYIIYMSRHGDISERRLKMASTFEYKKVELTQAQIKAIERAKTKGDSEKIYVLTTASNPKEEWRENNPYRSLEGVPLEELAVALFVPDSYRIRRTSEELLDEYYKKAQKETLSEDHDTRIKAQATMEAILHVVSIINTPDLRKFQESINDVPY